MNNNIQLFVYYIIYLLLVHNSSTIRKGHVINAIRSQKILWFAWCVAQWFAREEIAARNSLATKVRNTKISNLFLKKYILYLLLFKNYFSNMWDSITFSRMWREYWDIFVSKFIRNYCCQRKTCLCLGICVSRHLWRGRQRS